MDWKRKDGFWISDEAEKIDVAAAQSYLAFQSYWAKNVSLGRLQKAIQNSHSFGLFYQEQMIGLARVVTDYATVAYLADVYVLPQYQGRGLGIWLMKIIMDHPELQHLRRWFLATKDAHGLYEKFGFRPLSQPERFMEWLNKADFDGGWKIP